MPLLGNPTAAVLYPGQAHLRGPARTPGGAALRRSRIRPGVRRDDRPDAVVGDSAVGVGAWGRWRTPSAVPILFQYCNIIFLVGAAGSPSASGRSTAGSGWEAPGACSSWRWSWRCRTLGGDPEAAYLTGCLCGRICPGLAWAGRRSERSGWSPVLWVPGTVVVIGAWVAITLALARVLPGFRPKREPPPVLPWTPYHGKALLIGWAVVGLMAQWIVFRKPTGKATAAAIWGLIGSAALAAMLAAVQLVPAVEFTSRTARAATGGAARHLPVQPRTLAIGGVRLAGSLRQRG